MPLHYYVSSSNQPNIDVLWVVDPKQNDFFMKHVSDIRPYFKVWNLKKRVTKSGINLKWFGKLFVFHVVMILRFEDLLLETSRYLVDVEEINPSNGESIHPFIN